MGKLDGGNGKMSNGDPGLAVFLSLESEELIHIRALGHLRVMHCSKVPRPSMIVLCWGQLKYSENSAWNIVWLEFPDDIWLLGKDKEI